MGQVSLFGDIVALPETAPSLKPLPAPPMLEQLTWEKETLGIFVSGHPLADIAEALARAGAVPLKNVRTLEDGAQVTVSGMLVAVRRTLTKQMLIATLEDMTGTVEVLVFPKNYEQLQAPFVQDGVVTIKGRVNVRERRGGSTPGEEEAVEVSIIVSEAKTFERRALPPAPQGWHVRVRDRAQVDSLARLIDESPGDVPIVLYVGERSQRMPVGISNSVYVRSELEAIFGGSSVWEGAAG